MRMIFCVNDNLSTFIISKGEELSGDMG